MFAHQDLHPCAYTDEIGPDEDGIGYSLRLASDNAIAFNQLAENLASPGHLYLPYAKSSELAFMFGATPQRLSRAIVHRYFSDGSTIADYIGHTFYRPQHLRQTRPQLCPNCLVSEHRALASWSLTMMCCCTSCGTMLIDHCACNRLISWRRIDLETCRCNRIFGPEMLGARAPTAGALAICEQIEYLLGGAHFKLRRPDETVLCLFDEVSLDTFLRVVWAFGVLNDEQSAMHPKTANAIPSTFETLLILERAYQRMGELVCSRRFPITKIWRQSLELLGREVTRAADQRIVQSILQRLDASNLRRRRRRSEAHTVQLPLFGDVE
ncbi:TniQ family protein [Caballeronia sp. ATUFL_F2_KS9A]|uniref:TniQ family protein n=1 Tax=Caballeronia sp. ATUFL_F2_KS9A TaxID=2921777 RepID=UPI0032EE1089